MDLSIQTMNLIHLGGVLVYFPLQDYNKYAVMIEIFISCYHNAVISQDTGTWFQK